MSTTTSNTPAPWRMPAIPADGAFHPASIYVVVNKASNCAVQGHADGAQALIAAGQLNAVEINCGRDTRYVVLDVPAKWRGKPPSSWR